MGTWLKEELSFGFPNANAFDPLARESATVF
jgi:hypothetical protein